MALLAIDGSISFFRECAAGGCLNVPPDIWLAAPGADFSGKLGGNCLPHLDLPSPSFRATCLPSAGHRRFIDTALIEIIDGMSAL
jgi:hypothetical protein